jgi:FkbM family methyltransferase
MDDTGFNWGWLDADNNFSKTHKMLIRNEIFVRNMYETVLQVEEDDVVVDIGASVGPFAYSILSKKPSRVFCFEPSDQAFPILEKNVNGKNIRCFHAGISNTDGSSLLNSVFTEHFYQDTPCNTMKFKTFIEQEKIDHIDFMKTDCEGGEYDIFNIENFSWIQANIKKVVGEWHLSTPELKFKFQRFINLYLRTFNDYKVFSVDGVEVTDKVFTDWFTAYFSEVIIHINNKIPNNW